MAFMVFFQGWGVKRGEIAGLNVLWFGYHAQLGTGALQMSGCEAYFPPPFLPLFPANEQHDWGRVNTRAGLILYEGFPSFK